MSVKPLPSLPGFSDAVYAYIDDETEEVIAMAYEVPRLGFFIRKQQVWRFATEEDMYNLTKNNVSVVDIEREKALDLVFKFDDAVTSETKILETELEEYKEKEASE